MTICERCGEPQVFVATVYKCPVPDKVGRFHGDPRHKVIAGRMVRCACGEDLILR